MHIISCHEEGRNPHRSPQRSSLHAIHTVPRPARLLVVAIITLCALAGCLQGRANYIDQVKKSYPTDFSRLHTFDSSLWAPPHPIRYNNGTHIDDQYTYISHLGTGQEGSVSLYQDREGAIVALKTFSLPGRNRIPPELAGDFVQFTTTWPTEIEAGLLLNSRRELSFVPVLDYFILQESSGWSWALVSPLTPGGTLINLANRERASNDPSDLITLDRRYRPSLTSLLLALEDLHLEGICHDDVKPDNVFINVEQGHWLLGDLGNVREVRHSWHDTASWVRQNQLVDCKINDVKRALKTYLSFLRTASTDVDDFDRQFWAGNSPWSRLYWDFALRPIDAGRLARSSDALHLPNDGDLLIVTHRAGHGDLRDATERELTCTSLARRLWFA